MSVSPTTDPNPSANVANANGNRDVNMRSPAAAPSPSPRSTHPTSTTTTTSSSATLLTTTTSTAPSSHLAALLADAYAETEALRRDLVHAQKRADRAERVAASLQALHDSFGAAAAVSNDPLTDKQQQQPISPPPKTSQSPTQPPSSVKSPTPSNLNNSNKNTPPQSPPRPSPTTTDVLNHPALPAHAASLLLNALARADTAEAHADDAHARSRAIVDAWGQLDAFLGLVEVRAVDARAGFARVVRDEAGVLTLPGDDLGGSAAGMLVNAGPSGRRGRREHGWKTQALMSLPLPPHPPLTHVHSHSHGPGGSHSTPTLTNTPTHSHTHAHSLHNLPTPSHLLPNHTISSLNHLNSYPLPTGPPTNRRPRTPSLDAYGILPPKKARGAERDREREPRDRERERERGRDPGPRFTEPHHHPSHHHAHQSYPPPQPPPQGQGAEFFDAGPGQQGGYPHPQQHGIAHAHGHTRTSSRRSQSQSQNQSQSQAATQQNQSQPRMILPPRHHGAGYKQAGAYPPGFDEHRERERGRRRARSGSRSSASSLSVDEMLLQATTGDEGPGGNAGLVNAPGRNGISAPAPGSGVGPGVGGGTGRSRRGGGGGEERDGRGYEDPQGTPYQYNPPTSSASFRGGKAQQAQAQALGEPGQAREFQTHIFAPPVTGAPTKKNKFVNVNVTGEPAPAGNLGTATYPPTNEAGQRICRQCGMAGRYKDGKCVEKWGPGPMGPGTVCDRCRKKMKRVERRGTLENQQLAHAAAQQAQQQQAPSPHSLPTRSHSAIHRSDTLPVHHHSNTSGTGQTHLGFMHPRETESNLRSSSASGFRGSPARHHASQQQQQQQRHSPPPTIVTLRDDDIPTSAIGRGSEAAARANGHGHGRDRERGRASPNGSGLSVVGMGSGRQVKSPLGMLNGRGSRSPAVGMDVDADADADADAEADAEAEIEAEIEEVLEAGEGPSVGSVGAGIGAGAVGVGGGGRKRLGPGMEVDGEGEGDADADLLDAVDAAEANSSGSGGGRLKEEE